MAISSHLFNNTRRVASIRLIFNTWEGNVAESLGKVSNKLRTLVQHELEGYSAEAYVPVGNFVVCLRATVDMNGGVYEESTIYKKAIISVDLEEFTS